MVKMCKTRMEPDGRLRVVHVVPGISTASGGPLRSVHRIVSALNGIGVTAWLLTCYGKETPWVEGVSYFAGRESGLASSQSILRFFTQQFQLIKPDVVHVHSLWVMSSHWAVVVASRLGIPCFISPRGMLDPWAFHYKWWKKWPAWWLYQRRDLQKVAAFCAASEMEAEHIRAFGFRLPIVVSPNAVQMPRVLPEKIREVNKVALFLGRLHPGKGLLTLAEAWARIRPKGWVMRVIGPDQYKHKAVVVERLATLGILEDWAFIDELDDEVKWQELRKADLFIFPSVSENFGISIAEALYAGLPVIATKGTPWVELQTHQCGWWIELGVDALEYVMREAFSRTRDELSEMGENGHRLICSKYTWNASAERLKESYCSILGL